MKLKIHYINNLNAQGSTDKIIPVHVEPYIKWLIISYLGFCAIAWIIDFVYGIANFNSGRLDDDYRSLGYCRVRIYFMQGALLQCFIIFGISGVVTFLFFTTLYRISQISYILITSWIDRYLPLQRLKIRDLKHIKITKTLRKDAFERYLLIYHFMKETSMLWNLSICILITTSLIVTICLAILCIVIPRFALTCVSLMPAPILGFIAPSGCIAYVNSAMTKITEVLQYSSPDFDTMDDNCDYDLEDRIENKVNSVHSDNNNKSLTFNNISTKFYRNNSYLKIAEIESDFEVIGGRTLWLEYIKENPIYWTIYGFAITAPVLRSFAVGAVSSVAAGLISLTFSYLE